MNKSITLKIVGKIELPVERKKSVADAELNRAKQIVGKKSHKVQKIKYHSTAKFYDNTEYGAEYKKLRAKLYIAYDGKCCYCACKTKLPETGNNGIISDDTATVEHVYTRKDIRRLINKQVKLSCYRCNHDKGAVEYTQHIQSYDWQESYSWSLIDNAQLDRTWWQRVKYWWYKLKCNIWKTRK